MMRGKKRGSLALLIVMLTSLLLPPGFGAVGPAAVQAEEVNVIQNGSFENLTPTVQPGWTTRTADKWGIWIDTTVTTVAPIVTVDTIYHPDGLRSLKISSPAPNKSRLTVNQGNIPVVPNQEYRMSAKFKAQVLTGDTNAYGVNIRAVYLNAAGGVIKTDYITPENTPVRGNITDFKTYTVSTVAPLDAVTARMDIEYNRVTGNVWIDDVQFKPYTSLQGLSFLETSGLMQVGGVLTAPLVRTPYNTSDLVQKWTSSDPSIATVDGSGVVTGLTPGTVKISVSSQDDKFSASYTVIVTQASVLKNGGFETSAAGSGNGFTDSQATDWTASAAYGSPTVTVDDAVYGAGSRALSIRATVNSKASAVQRNIPVTAGGWYRLSGKIKTEALTGTGASLRLNWNGSGGTVLGTVYGPPPSVKGTSVNWQSYEGFFQAPPGTLNASLYAYYETGTGKAWFDDLQIIPWVPLTGLTPDGELTRSLSIGGSVSLNVYGSPANATDQRVTWSSSRPDIADVSYDGRVTAKAQGKAVVTATSVERGWTQSYTIYVMAINNGGFETTVPITTGWTGSKPLGWTLYFNSTDKPTVSLDTSIKKEGANSLKIDASLTGKAVVYNPIDGAVSGKSYKVSGWLKQQNGGSNVYLRVLYLKADNSTVLPAPNFFDVIPSTGLQDSNGWTYYESIITVPELTASARVEVAFELGKGTLWADGIRVIPWVPVSSIQLDQGNGQLALGESKVVTATLQPSEVTNPTLSWTSDHVNIATVVGSSTNPLQATVSGIALGIATIRASAESHKPGEQGRFATYTVIVGTETDITATDDHVSVNEDQGVTRPVLASDAAGDALSSTVLLKPLHGSASLREDGSWIYYPDAEYNGEDNFTLLISDGHDHFALSKITLTILPVQDAPVMDNVQISLGTVRGSAISGVIKAKDKDNDVLTFTKKPDQAPQHGSLTLDSASGAWTYTPTAGYTGYDRFQFVVSDGHGGEDTTTFTIYVGLPGSEMIASLIARHPATGAAHPRLYASTDDFDRIRGLIVTDPIMQEWYAKVKAIADDMLDDPLLTYTITDPTTAGATVLPLAQALMKRIQTLALLYQITNDTGYAAAAIAQLNLMANSQAYPDWNGGLLNFLSISEMGNVASIGYDWLYDAMTQQERDNLRTRILQEVLLKAKDAYSSKVWWTTSPSNWNLVVNGGLTAASLTIGDETDARPTAASVLQSALTSVQVGLGVFAQQGDWPEGTGYWDYATEYLAFMISALRTNLGTDYDFFHQPGIAETSSFMANLHSYNGPFNYSDSVNTLVDTPQLLFFADLLNSPDVTWYRNFTYSKNKLAEPLDLIWYRPGTFGSSDPASLDALYNHRLKNNIASFRDSWKDPNGSFVGIKGGITDYAITNSTHADLDIGTFVMDALGVRWAVDLGKDNYGLYNYSYVYLDRNPNRWDYYRTRAEGSNTLVINPDEGPDQAIDARASIIAFDSKPAGGYAVVDMTSAYPKDVVFAKRGMMLGQDRGSFLVQDEVQLKTTSNLYWFMHTEAEVTILAGCKSAILKQNGKRLYAQLVSPGAGSFEVMEAKTLQTNKPAGEAVNSGQKKLTIHFPAANDFVTIAVRFTPLLSSEEVPADTPIVTPLQAWSIDTAPSALLSELKLNGVPLANFESLKKKYAVELPFTVQGTPVVTAVSADPNDTVTITQAAGIPGMAIIEVTDDQGISRPSKYVIDLARGVYSGILENVPVLPITYVADSGPVGNAWPGTNAIDNNPNTYWSVGGPNTIDFDLGSETKATYVGISWVRGNERRFNFNVLASLDGVNWTPIYEGPSSGKVTGTYEIYDIPDTTARYLRLAVNGNNNSPVSSITEVMVYGE
ncbi:Ig-like domain-containing protein [Paenibacillus qinlingensis]|nr:Ig-like domain-containing protein [Paenibacillus qinlingensis]